MTSSSFLTISSFPESNMVYFFHLDIKSLTEYELRVKEDSKLIIHRTSLQLSRICLKLKTQGQGVLSEVWCNTMYEI